MNRSIPLRLYFAMTLIAAFLFSISYFPVYATTPDPSVPEVCTEHVTWDAQSAIDTKRGQNTGDVNSGSIIAITPEGDYPGKLMMQSWYTANFLTIRGIWAVDTDMQNVTLTMPLTKDNWRVADPEKDITVFSPAPKFLVGDSRQEAVISTKEINEEKTLLTVTVEKAPAGSSLAINIAASPIYNTDNLDEVVTKANFNLNSTVMVRNSVSPLPPRMKPPGISWINMPIIQRTKNPTTTL